MKFWDRLKSIPTKWARLRL